VVAADGGVPPMVELDPKEHRNRSGGTVAVYSRDGATETMWSGEHMCPAQETINAFWSAHFGQMHYHNQSEFKAVRIRVNQHSSCGRACMRYDLYLCSADSAVLHGSSTRLDMLVA
jgi:hypothetical protein